ncbi:SRPBCC family protein [Aeromicrobium sp. CF3.5]|uniref:SRPBCC family protein n=1 Tax=Aeromicrobium sp. CF3.5 TaxID=3373078 RepID=UPI003EE71965
MPSISCRIAVAPEVAWRLLTDLDAWPAWGPSIVGASIDQGTSSSGDLCLGARGTVRTVVGVSLPFEVTEFVDGQRWAWAVAGVPATGHRVEATADGCAVTFTVPWWAPGYLVVCALALGRIDRLATSPATGGQP